MFDIRACAMPLCIRACSVCCMNMCSVCCNRVGLIGRESQSNPPGARAPARRVYKTSTGACSEWRRFSTAGRKDKNNAHGQRGRALVRVPIPPPPRDRRVSRDPPRSGLVITRRRTAHRSRFGFGPKTVRARAVTQRRRTLTGLRARRAAVRFGSHRFGRRRLPDRRRCQMLSRALQKYRVPFGVYY